MNFDNFYYKKIDQKATTERLKNMLKRYVMLLPKRVASNVTKQEAEQMAELERCYNLLPDDYRMTLSNWFESEETAKTDKEIYNEMEIEENIFYRQKQKAIVTLATMLGVEVYLE